MKDDSFTILTNDETHVCTVCRAGPKTKIPVGKVACTNEDEKTIPGHRVVPLIDLENFDAWLRYRYAVMHPSDFDDAIQWLETNAPSVTIN